MQQLQSVNAKSVLRYMVLPGIIPRIREFAKDGFGWLAFLMATTYQGARLLPKNHPYCNPENKGRYGIRHVIAEAANNLVLRRENIDQIIIFVAMLVGLVLLVLQGVLLLGSMVLKTAYAAPTPFSGMFNTANAENDIALSLLAQVFGIPKLFCSANGSSCTTFETSLPTPFHEGLHELFHFYNLAILLVGVLVLLYYVIIVVGETAHTGTPFGRRFNHIWAPMRLVVAVGLLVPLNYGLNSAQYLTLFSARMGSGFATNAWLLFNNGLVNASGLEDASLVARASAPDMQYLAKFMMLVTTCKNGYEMSLNKDAVDDDSKVSIEGYFVKNDQNIQVTMGEQQGPPSPGSSLYEEGRKFYENGDIVIRFGHHDANVHARETGHVKPYCGEITIHKVDHTSEMARGMAEAYFNIISMILVTGEFNEFGKRAAERNFEFAMGEGACGSEEDGDGGGGGDPAAGGDSLGGAPCGTLPGHAWRQETLKEQQAELESAVINVYAENIEGKDYKMPQELLDRGWGGAGIWYNRIAQWNGAWIAAVRNVPTPSKLPWPMEQVQNARRGQVNMMNSIDRYNPMVEGYPVEFELGKIETSIAVSLDQAYRYWNEDSPNEATDVRDMRNPIINLISMIFGLDGLFTIRENQDIHPLAQLVALGKGIIDAAIRNLSISIGTAAVAGGLERVEGTKLAGSALSGVSSIFMAFTTVGLTIGFILYYIMPFMPFMYFFFAVGAWVKSIFEAMVGVPLWALAHLRIDGNGLPGDLAMNGYFLIFEIFIRPILTVFGLLASLAIFTAMVRVLHEIFPLVTQNTTGFDGTSDTKMKTLLYTQVAEKVAGIEFKRDVIDEFFFTIIYTILVYMTGTSCFKLIDQIPNNILRWMGAGVASFNDQRGNMADSLVQYAALGGSSVARQATGIMQQTAQGAGSVVGTGANSLLGSLSGRANVITGGK